MVARDHTAVPPAVSRPKRGRLWVAMGIVLAFGVLGFGTWEYTSTPGFCGSCHEISPSVTGFADSAHAKEAACMDCHADEGLPGEFVAHIGGVQEAYVHLTQSPEASDIRGTVPAERCLACHEKDWAKLPADHPTKEAPCGVCHRDSAHANDKPLYVKEKAGESR